MIVKQPGQKHFTKDFGDSTVSDRIIVGALDGCEAEVRIFRPKAGFCPGINVTHSKDETVYVLEGKIQITGGVVTHVLGPTGLYFCEAGTPTTFLAVEDSVILCVFHGQLPEGE